MLKFQTKVSNSEKIFGAKKTLVDFKIEHMQFFVESFKETSQYCDEWRKFTSVSE